MEDRGPRRRRVAWLVGAVVALVVLALAVIRAQLVSRVELALTRATGHRVVVGGAALRPGLVIARNIRVFGAPPFDAEPLARIERLEVGLGGPGGFLHPARVLVEGMDVEYLSTGAMDNVLLRRTLTPTGERAGTGVGGPHLQVQVRRARLRATLRLPGLPRISARAREITFDQDARGARKAGVEDLVIELSGYATASVPVAQLERVGPGAPVRLRGEGGRLAVPAGGGLVEDVVLEGSWAPSGAFEMTATRQPTPRSPKAWPRLRAAVRAERGQVHLSVDAAELALRALHAWLDPAGAQVDTGRAHLRFSASLARGRSAVPFEIELRARGLELRNPAVDRRPWPDLSVSLQATGAWDVATERLEVRQGQVEVLGAKLQLDGWSERASGRGSWNVRTPRTSPLPCETLLGAQAAPVRHTLRGLRLAGRLGLSVALTYDASAWDSLGLDLTLTPRCVVEAEPAVLASVMSALRTGTGMPSGLPRSDFASLASMPAHLVSAFLTAEDGRFFDHAGFDLEMIRRALAHDLEMRAFAKGGSTITQQLAKNLFLGQSRTLARKLEETVLAWRLHELVDKKRILEMYLNVIELGPGIRGVKQAARAYFGKELRELRPIESAHLAALTPNPQGYARRFRDGRVDEGWLQRLYDLLGMMNRSGRLSREDLAAARAGKLALRKI